MRKKCLWCGKETKGNKDFCCHGHLGNAWRKAKRIKRRLEHRCADCGIKVKPYIVYPYRCRKHEERAKIASEKAKQMKGEK